MQHNVALGEFLRSRRARLTPEEAGFKPHGGPRRVPGLRREEVAHLAGVSADYYGRLEQGRDLNVSEAVLGAVASALRLNTTERTHLFELASRAPTIDDAPPPAGQQPLRAGLMTLVHTLDHVPVVVVGRRLDVLACNALARTVLTDFERIPPSERNFARFLFLDPLARERIVEWREMAADTVAALRRHSGRHRGDPLLGQLVAELSARDADFRHWWSHHDVLDPGHLVKRIRHPAVGELTFQCESVTFPDDPDVYMNIYAAEAGSRTEKALRSLRAAEQCGHGASAL
ncbi:helix-turn-helix transcriptional regulator [Streptomyces sp. NPDC026672]|uniref:helix-turn-helix transcriptional regulator n=1 Tax=unclassified Streptomyces TaxID=2593676 RepID=UPI0033D35FBB